MKILSAPLSRLRLARRFNWRNITFSAKTVGGASYALLAVLFALLIFAVVIAVAGWHSAAGADVPVIGYVAMAGGVLLSLAVGIGLMVLPFYSSRAGYDDPPKYIIPEEAVGKWTESTL